MQKTSKIWKITKEDFCKIVNESETYSEIMRKCGLQTKGGNYQTIKRRIRLEKIDDSHIPKGKESNKNRKFLQQRKPTNKMLVKNSKTSRHTVKKRIIEEKIIPYICNECGLKDEWNGKKISLQLEHINGVNNDNRIKNLCFLCPNCHSQTDTYAGKKHKKRYTCLCGNEKKCKSSQRCQSCANSKIVRPNKETLQKQIKEINNWCKIGRMYGVSDNAVRKWAKKYQLI